MTEKVKQMEEALIECPPEIALLIKVGLADQRSVPSRHGQSLTSILEIFATERGCLVEELIIIREGESEPLSAVIVIDEHYPRQRRHHVHHVREVVVKVHYQVDTHEQAFRRHATVEHVLKWAYQAFDIDSTMAAEVGLARHGKEDELLGAEHIGHVAGHHHVVELDLVRGPIVNGASR